MAIRHADSAMNAACDAVVDLVDADTDPGYIEIRSGSQPANPGIGATGTLLATVVLGDPAYGDAGAGGNDPGVATLLDTPLEDDNPGNSGTAGWFRVYDGDDNPVFDGTIATSNADMIVNTTTVTSGVPFRINTGSYTHPLSNE